jgi:uncharacterized protein YneF (UPF0154 family)
LKNKIRNNSIGNNLESLLAAVTVGLLIPIAVIGGFGYLSYRYIKNKIKNNSNYRNQDTIEDYIQKP